MPSNDIISVIVPIYKVEKYLDACVKSIVSQTYQQLEIILVDDGSPDQCGEICDTWAKKDERIAVYHKENGGLSDARNYGTERAHGKYITFVDSDDVIAPDFISYLYDLLRVNGADAACCDYVRFEADPCPFPETTRENVQTLDGRQACSTLMAPPLLRVEACSKIYRTDIVKQYLFPVGRIHEDEATTFKFIYNSKLVVIGTRKLYGYRQRRDSIMGIARQKAETVNNDLVWCMRHLAIWFEDRGEKTLSAISWNGLFNRVLAYDACFSPHRYSELLWEIASHCTRCKIMSPKQYIKLFAYYMTPHVLRAYYRKKFNKGMAEDER